MTESFSRVKDFEPTRTLPDRKRNAVCCLSAHICAAPLGVRNLDIVLGYFGLELGKCTGPFVCAARLCRSRFSTNAKVGVFWFFSFFGFCLVTKKLHRHGDADADTEFGNITSMGKG